MTQPIFREALVERLSTPEQLDQVMQVTSPAAWMAMVALACVVVGGLAWGVLGVVPIKVQGKGILISPAGVLDVVSSSQGRISALKVGAGDRIDIGQVVATLAQPDIEAELAAARAQLADNLDHHRQVKAFNDRNTRNQATINAKLRAALQQRLTFLEDRLRWLRERETYEAELRDKGLIDRKRVIDTKIDINNAREQRATTQNEIQQVDLDEATLAIEQEREVLALELEIGRLTREVEGLTERLSRNAAVVSPYAGRIVELKVNAGEVIEPGRGLFTLLPKATAAMAPDAEEVDVVAKIYVAPEDGKKIRPGMAAEVAPSTVKREEYGFIVGRVRDVADVPSSEEGMLRVLKNRNLVQELAEGETGGGGAPFEVTVELERDPKAISGFRWSSSRGPQVDINPGTLCQGTVTVREVRLLSLMIPALEQMFEEQVLEPGASPRPR